VCWCVPRQWIGRLHAFYEVHRAVLIQRAAEGDEVDGRGERETRESLAITAALLLRSMVANLYDKQPVLGVHACNRIYMYTYVAGGPG